MLTLAQKWRGHAAVAQHALTFVLAKVMLLPACFGLACVVLDSEWLEILLLQDCLMVPKAAADLPRTNTQKF